MRTVHASSACPGVAMGARLLCCVALCLLGAGEYWGEKALSSHSRLQMWIFYPFRVPLKLVSFLSNPLPGSFDAKVTQIPRHLVKEKGQKANMVCFPEKGHTAFYWYQQSQKELKLLINFRNEEIIEQTDLVKKRFSAKCPSNSPCSLEIQSSEAGDAGLYFCASSQDTALQCAFPSVHKPHCGQTSGSRWCQTREESNRNLPDLASATADFTQDWRVFRGTGATGYDISEIDP